MDCIRRLSLQLAICRLSRRSGSLEFGESDDAERDVGLKIVRVLLHQKRILRGTKVWKLAQQLSLPCPVPSIQLSSTQLMFKFRLICQNTNRRIWISFIRTTGPCCCKGPNLLNYQRRSEFITKRYRRQSLVSSLPIPRSALNKLRRFTGSDAIGRVCWLGEQVVGRGTGVRLNHSEHIDER